VGRGAWLCRDNIERCLDAAIDRRQFDRSWRDVLDAADIESIRAAVRYHCAEHDAEHDEEDTR